MPKRRSFDIAPLPLEVQLALQDFGTGIVQARKERGYSQRVLADMMGISLTTLVSLERGAPSVQIGHYARAAWLLDIAFPRTGAIS